MNDLINNIFEGLRIIIAAIGLLVSSLLSGEFPTSDSLATLLGTQPPQVATSNNQENSDSSYNSNQNNSSYPKVRNRQEERVAQRVRELPTAQYSRSQKVTDQVTVYAGDDGVADKRLTKTNQIITDISLPTLDSLLGLAPGKNIQVVLFSSPKTYGNALRQAGVDENSIQSIVEDTGGLAINTAIWIPLYNLEDNSDLTNSLSHELFHACASSYGYGNRLTTWINEGTAWRVGLAAMKKVDSRKASLLMDYLEENVRNAAQDGTLLPLTATEEDILKAPYSVEYEDYMAVEDLVNEFGSSTYKQFIQNLKTQNVRSDFQNSFTITMEEYQNSFIESLQ